MDKRLAQALADILGNIVQVLTDSQLREALEDCNWCSETNCGWVEYHLSPTVHEVVANEIDHRLTQKEKRDDDQ